MQQISHDRFVATNPNRSSNTQTISFFSNDRLLIQNHDNTNFRELVEFDDNFSILSADSQPNTDVLVIASIGGNESLLTLVDLSTGEQSTIFQQAYSIKSVRWSHNGEQIAYTSQSPSTVHIITPESQESSRLLASNLLIGDLEWSEDDQYLYVTLYNGQGRSMSTIEVSTGNVITNETPDYYYDSPVTSPSGDEIAFVGSDENGVLQLYTTDLERDNTQQITNMSCNVSSPRWYDFRNS